MIDQAIHKQSELVQPERQVFGVGFFDRDARIVARELIGQVLVREYAGAQTRIDIAETEAYLGSHDLASHASRGRTALTEVLFGPAGVFYIYLIYGLHWMLNVVTGPAGHPSAVLIRGAGPYKGPGQLTRGLDISRDLNGKMAHPSSGLWFENAVYEKPLSIKAGPRVSVDYAGPVWSRRTWWCVTVAVV